MDSSRNEATDTKYNNLYTFYAYSSSIIIIKCSFI